MARPKATLELSEGERSELQALARRRKSGQAVSDRHKPAIPESAYIGHLSRPSAPAGVGICRPARSRHIPATA